MKLFGKRSLTAILSKVVNVCFYIYLFGVIFVLLGMLTLLSKPDLNNIVNKIPLLWLGNGIELQYQGSAALLKMKYLYAISHYVEGIVFLYILLCLKRVFSNFREGILFSKDQVKYIKRFGLLMIFVNIAHALYQYVLSYWLLDLVHLKDVSLKNFFDLDLNVIFLSIFSVILAYVINHITLTQAEPAGGLSSHSSSMAAIVTTKEKTTVGES